MQLLFGVTIGFLMATVGTRVPQELKNKLFVLGHHNWEKTIKIHKPDRDLSWCQKGATCKAN